MVLIEYSKDYDKVNRHKLDMKGCRIKFLLAKSESLMHSSGIIGKETFSTTAGVKHEGCTSCPLFTLFISPTTVDTKGPKRWPAVDG